MSVGQDHYKCNERSGSRAVAAHRQGAIAVLTALGLAVALTRTLTADNIAPDATSPVNNPAHNRLA